MKRNNAPASCAVCCTFALILLFSSGYGLQKGIKLLPFDSPFHPYLSRAAVRAECRASDADRVRPHKRMTQLSSAHAKEMREAWLGRERLMAKGESSTM